MYRKVIGGEYEIHYNIYELKLLDCVNFVISNSKRLLKPCYIYNKNNKNIFRYLTSIKKAIYFFYFENILDFKSEIDTLII